MSHSEANLSLGVFLCGWLEFSSVFPDGSQRSLILLAGIAICI